MCLLRLFFIEYIHDLYDMCYLIVQYQTHYIIIIIPKHILFIKFKEVPHQCVLLGKYMYTCMKTSLFAFFGKYYTKNKNNSRIQHHNNNNNRFRPLFWKFKCIYHFIWMIKPLLTQTMSDIQYLHCAVCMDGKMIYLLTYHPSLTDIITINLNAWHSAQPKYKLKKA